MKVILLAPTPPPIGGIAAWTLRMKNSKLKNNWKVRVVDEKLIGNRQVYGGITKRKIHHELFRNLKIWKDLIQALSEKDATVVHSCIPATFTGMSREIVCGLITKISKRKFIVHYRCTLPNMVKKRREIFAFKLLTKISDKVFVLNNSSKEFVETYSKTNCIIIPNFIEKTLVKDQQDFSVRKEIKKVVYVGGVIESKGCKDIISVAKEFPNIEFHLVGRVNDDIQAMKKTKNVILNGEKTKDEVHEILLDSDLFMFVSYFSGEGFSNALVEAMACGLPCLVSDWAANRDMIESGGGVVVEVKNTEQMISAIKNLEKDYIRRKRQSKWNLEKVKNNYTDEIITSLYVDEYEKLVKDGTSL